MTESKKRSLGSRLASSVGLLAVAGFVALLAYGLVAQSPDRTIDDALSRREAAPAPGFDLSVLSNGVSGPLETVWRRAARDGRVDLKELRGTPVVMNIWASWCAPCREEAPILQRGWRTARRKGVLFVGLNMQDTREDALDFIRQFRQDFPQVRDGTRDSSRRWGATGIPETFYISRRGEVVGHAIGTVTDALLSDGIATALSGRPRGAKEGGEQRPAR